MAKLHDKYFKLAKREGHLARSYYKLEELHRRNRLFRRGARVLDLGSCPGSWLEFILSVIGNEGVVCAVDRNPIHKQFKGKVHFKLGTIEAVTPDTFRHAAKAFDVIVSDMAPNTSGVKILDQGRSLLLCETAFALAERTNKPLILGLILAHVVMLGFSLGIEALYQRHWWLVMALIGSGYVLVKQQKENASHGTGAQEAMERNADAHG